MDIDCGPLLGGSQPMLLGFVEVKAIIIIVIFIFIAGRLCQDRDMQWRGPGTLGRAQTQWLTSVPSEATW